MVAVPSAPPIKKPYKLNAYRAFCFSEGVTLNAFYRAFVITLSPHYFLAGNLAGVPVLPVPPVFEGATAVFSG